MLTKNTYGVNLSNYFNNAIEAEAQNVKPKITIDLLDSRHMTLENVLISGEELVSITNTDAHTVTSEGSIGYYCTEQQMINGYERESFTWAVTDALDKNGKIITADGSWHCMPTSLDTDSKLDGDYEYGWWSKTRSQANGVFASSPVVTFAFEERKVNKIRVTTSEYYGQVKSFRIKVKNAALVDILDQTVTLTGDEYYKDIYLNSNNAIASSFLAKRIEITIISTKNGLDYGRIHEISPIYEVDITDFVIDYSISRARDIHESNLPIGGTSSPKLTLKIDNTGKDWNILNNSSTYGKYMKKDLKINVSTGWRIKKTNDVISNTVLRSNMSNVASSFTVDNSDIFPTGGVNNNFIITINPNKENREVILCNAVTSTNTVSVTERGVGQTDANTHAAGSVVTFDPYEYVSMGEFYVDEWSSSSSDMTVSVSASDFTKYLTEKNLTNGFLLESKTVSEAVSNLLSRRNFPKRSFKQVLPYSRGISQLGGVARYSFSEDAIDKNGSLADLNPGLRVRLWAMKDGKQLEYQTIKNNVLEKNISVEERIKGLNAYTAPDLTENSRNISSPRTVGPPLIPSVNALNLVNYTFQSNLDSATYTKYFNGVIDGYYFSTTLSLQSLVLDISNGGGRIYLDDLLIGEAKGENQSVSITSISMNLTPGVPYRLRIEFFHGFGDSNFSMSLHSLVGATKALIPASQFRSVVARDGLGSRNLTGVVPTGYSINDISENHHQNDAFIHANAALDYSGQIVSDDNNKGILLIDDAYIRIPTHTSIAIKEEDFTIELLAKFNDGHFDIGDGEYLSSWANSNPTNGFEFYYNNVSSHGFKIKTTGPTTNTAFVSDTTDLLQSEFYHISVTYKVSTKTLSYYINGELKDTDTVNGEISTNIFDTTIGGRGSRFSTQEIAPSIARQFIIDEYAIYKKCLTPEEILDRYISSQVEYVAVFPYLYSEQANLRGAIDEITLADLGRFYIDEEGYGRYEHYNRFFEPSINQHAVKQYDFSDTTNILDSSFDVQLQTNKVVVKISTVSKLSIGSEILWSADDGVSLGVVKLMDSIDDTDTSLRVSTTTNPVFANVGYLAFTQNSSTEIVRYNSKSDKNFLNLERGKFGTPILSSVAANTKIREARYYEVSYDKKPAVTVLSPIATGIIDDEPNTIDILKFESNPYTARVIVCASENVGYDTHVYLQGEDPRSNIVSSFAIYGIPVISSENTAQVTEKKETLSDNVRKYGLKELTIESPYITSEDHAQKIAQFIIDKVSDPVPIITVNTMCVPKIQLGDRIRITSLDAFDITNQEYWVISQEFSYGESLSQSLTLRKVV
jgi:hypothetical protein